MQQAFSKILLFALIVVAGSACSKFRKIQKSTDWKIKYEAALNYYEKKDYYRANVLLEEILPIIRGTEEAEKANFVYAYTYYYQKQYILSAHYFNLFTQVYGRSQMVQEAAFMNAKSLYMQSPQPSLDQGSTYEAIAALQEFLNTYPTTSYLGEAEAMINELQVKLESKAYANAKLYYRLRYYKSALIAFDNFKLDYPDSKYNEELAFRAIEMAYELARQSVVSKQEERYSDTVTRCQKFLDQYTQSTFQKEVENIYTESTEQLANFARQNQKNQ